MRCGYKDDRDAGSTLVDPCTVVSGPRLQNLSTCLDEVSAWMCANWPQLNTSKTEAIGARRRQQQQQLPTTEVRVWADHVAPSKCNLEFLSTVTSP